MALPRPENIVGLPVLSRKRVMIAVATAVITDLFQLVLGPLGVTFADEILDVFAMIVTTAALGFHPLLLPTFLVELVPLVDILPTWTGCVLVVLAIRRRASNRSTPYAADVVDASAPPRSAEPPVIDI